MLVAMHHLLYVTSFFGVGDFAQVRNNCFRVDDMKQLFQDIQIDNIITFLKEINLFNKILSLLL